MTDPYVALLGVGSWGRNHLRVLGGLGVLRRAWDIDARVLAGRVRPEHQARGLEEILGDPGIRAVVVATPSRTHHELALRVLESGRDVLVEKPLTLHENEAAGLVSLASRSGRILMVGHVTLYHPALVALKGMVDAGELGRLRYVYSNRLNLGTVRETEDILWSFAPHDVAVLLHLLSRWPLRISAVGGSWLRSDRADVTVTHLEFPEGVRAHIHVSWLHPFKEHRLVVIGDRRMAVFSDGPEGGELTLYDQPARLPENAPVSPRGEGRRFPFERTEPLRQEVEHFLRCVASREEPRSGGRHGLDVLRILETARASLAEGGMPLACERQGSGFS